MQKSQFRNSLLFDRLLTARLSLTMKLSIATSAFIVTYLATVNAAPSVYEAGNAISKREVDHANDIIASIDTLKTKRDTLTISEIQTRENQIVTDVLKAIDDTNLAPGIIKYIIDDPTLSKIATDAIVGLVKSGVVNMDTLLKGLNDSGLATQVITDLINDCDFYAEIYKIALSAIGDLVGKVFGKRELEEQVAELQALGQQDLAKRATSTAAAPAATDSGDSNSQKIITSLMESLKSSGLASSVVKELVVDDKFYSWGADLIKQLFESDALTVGELIDALIQSGLIPTLIKEFLNFSTLRTVIVNALKAAAGKCDASTLSTISATTTITPSSAGPGPTGTCKKRKRRSY